MDSSELYSVKLGISLDKKTLDDIKNSLKKQLDSEKNLKNLQKEINETKKNEEKIAKSVSKLEEKISKEKSKQKNSSEETKELKKTVNDLGKAFDKVASSLKNIRDNTSTTNQRLKEMSKEIDRVSFKAKDIGETSSGGGGMSSWFETEGQALENLGLSLKELNKDYLQIKTVKESDGSVTKTYNDGLGNTVKIYEKLTAKGSEYKAVLEAINTLNKNATSNVKYIKSMDEALKRITLTKEEISDIGNALGGEVSTSFKVAKADIKANGDSIYELRNNLDKVVTITKKTVNGIDQFSASLRKVKKNAKEARDETGTWMYSWKQAWQSFLTYMTVTDVFYKAYHTLLSMIKVTTELDSAFVELRKVTDLEGASLKRFSEEATKMGREVAKTTKEMIESATAFAKAGYSDAEVLQLGKIAAMYTNIADEEISTAEAAEFIIAQLKAFNFEADKSMHIIDAVNEVSNNYAVSSTELAENLGKVAATLSATGTSFEESLGLLTAITEQTRNATTAANALKTLSARLRGLTDESEDYSELVPKLSKEFRSLGIEMYDVDGQIKSTYELTKDLSKVWKTLDKNTQAYLGELFAGKYQLNNFFALMNNFESAIKATETAMKSEGSALEENAKSINSVEGHLQSLRTSWEALSKSLVDTNVINAVLSSASLLLQVLNKSFSIFNNTISRTLLYTMALSKAIQLIKKTEKGAEIFSLLTKQKVGIKNDFVAFKELVKEIGLFNAASTKMKNIWANHKVGLSIVGISAALSAASAYADYLNKRIEETRESLDNLADYKLELSEISEKLEDNNMLSSDREAIISRLIELQKKLNEEYGITLKNINLKDNSRLKEEIDLTTKLIELKEKERALELLKYSSSFKEAFNFWDFIFNPKVWFNQKEIDKQFREYTEYTKDALIKANKELKNAFEEFENSLSEENINENLLAERFSKTILTIDGLDITDEQRSILIEYANKQYQAYKDALQKTFNEQKVTDLYNKTFGFNTLIKNALEKGIDSKDFREVIRKIVGVNGLVDENLLRDIGLGDGADLGTSVFKNLLSYMIDLSKLSGVPLEEVLDIIIKLNPEFKNLDELINENVGSFERFKEELANIKDIYNTVTGALNEWNQNGYLSLDTLSNLMENWDKYSKYIEESNGALVLNEELLRKETEAKLDEIKATMYANAIKEINRIMELDEAGAKRELIDKTQEQAKETNKLAEAYLNLAKSEAVEAEIKGNTYKGQLIQETIDDIENRMKLLNASMKNIFGSLNLGSASASTKAWWEQTLDNLKDQFSYNEITINEYISGLEKLLGRLKKGTDAWKKVNDELQKQRLDKLKDDYSAARISLSQYIDGLQLLIKSYKEGTDAWNNLASEIKKAKLDALKKEQDDLNGALSAVNKTLDDQIKSYQDLKEASDKRYEDEIDNLKKLADSLSDSSDEYKKAQQATLDYLDEQLNILNNQKQELEDYYNTVVDSLENMNKEQETAIKLAEAYETLMNAMTNKSKKVWVENIGFVWTTDQKAIEDARKNYEDLLKTATIDDINKQKENTVQSLDTQIEALQKYIDTWGDVFDKFDKEQNRNMADLLLGDNWQDLVVALDPEIVNNFADSYYNLQVQLDDVNKKIEELTDKKDQQDEYYDKLIEDLEKYKDLWGDVSSNYTDEQNRLLAQEQFGADFEAQILSKRLDTLNNFKNKYNAISKEIGAFDTMSDNASVGYSVPSFSNGGTVDFTGLAMLHGSPSRPEYVLNTDQVTNLLSNLTKPQVVSTMPKVGNSSVANYNFGNIELPNVTNAQQFINELKSLVNVTKNT